MISFGPYGFRIMSISSAQQPSSQHRASYGTNPLVFFLAASAVSVHLVGRRRIGLLEELLWHDASILWLEDQISVHTMDHILQEPKGDEASGRRERDQGQALV